MAQPVSYFAIENKLIGDERSLFDGESHYRRAAVDQIAAKSREVYLTGADSEGLLCERQAAPRNWPQSISRSP